MRPRCWECPRCGKRVAEAKVRFDGVWHRCPKTLRRVDFREVNR